NVPESPHHPAICRDLEMRFELEPAHELRNCRIDHECIKEIYMIAHEETRPCPVEAGRIMHLETNTGQPENVAEEPALRLVIPARVHKDSQEHEHRADREGVSRTDYPEDYAPDDKVGIPHIRTSRADGSTSSDSQWSDITSPSTMTPIGFSISKSMRRARPCQTRG